jgi:hypothetical protein
VPSYCRWRTVFRSVRCALSAPGCAEIFAGRPLWRLPLLGGSFTSRGSLARVKAHFFLGEGQGQYFIRFVAAVQEVPAQQGKVLNMDSIALDQGQVGPDAEFDPCPIRPDAVKGKDAESLFVSESGENKTHTLRSLLVHGAVAGMIFRRTAVPEGDCDAPGNRQVNELPTVVTACAATTTAAGAFGFGTGFIDVQRSAVEFAAIQFRNGAIRIGIRAHFNKSESSGLTGITIGDDANAIDGTVRLEHGPNAVFRSSEAKVSNKNILHFFLCRY